MIRKGFIFNYDLCVSCQACSAGCILENGWNAKPRTVYQVNPDCLITIPAINISMACNHCNNPSCLKSCPTNAFFIDNSSGSVLVDESKCFGCNYCIWNCPYDAPKSDIRNGIISKCNFCVQLLSEGSQPACTSACPTGAMKYGDIADIPDNSMYPWLAERNLNPRIEIKGDTSNAPLKIIPEKIYNSVSSSKTGRRKRIADEWSLILFSFLTALSVALMCTYTLTGKTQNKLLIISITLLSGLVSFLHLGRKQRAWRAVTNFLSSALSREIAVYLIYTALTIFSLVSEIPGLLITASVSGLILLLTIDSVYTHPDQRIKLLFHSGQTFLTGLLIGSFFSVMTVSFLFIAVIKMFSGFYYLISERNERGIFGIRFLRLAFLAAAGFIMIRGMTVYDPLVICLFLTGELIDRWLFYIDFTPDNIRTRISEYTQKIIK